MNVEQNNSIEKSSIIISFFHCMKVSHFAYVCECVFVCMVFAVILNDILSHYYKCSLFDWHMYVKEIGKFNSTWIINWTLRRAPQIWSFFNNNRKENHGHNHRCKKWKFIVQRGNAVHLKDTCARYFHFFEYVSSEFMKVVVVSRSCDHIFAIIFYLYSSFVRLKMIIVCEWFSYIWFPKSATEE